MATLTSQNPYTGEINTTVDTLTNDELDVVIERAHQAYLSRKETTIAERGALFYKMADLIDQSHEEIGRLTTIEMGMLQHVSQNILKGLANLIRRYADHAEEVLGEKSFEHDGMKGKTLFDPLGVIYGIAPWNFPYQQVLRAALANIMAGNTTVYKHASNVPLCAAKIEELFIQAGFPQGVYTNIFITGSQSEHIIAHPAISGINITASETAGSLIGGLAGKYLKPSVLELGGNDPFLLLDHNNTEKIAAEAVACRISMGGQRCNSSKRFIILEEHYDEFVKHMTHHMEQMKIGDPMESTTQLPPMATTKLLKNIDQQVQESIAQGARLMTGGKIVGDRKQFYEGTVLADVTPEMTSYREEVFGPVASIIKSKSIEYSIQLANQSDFGLSAVVFGDDIEQCRSVAERLEGGMVFINQPAGSRASLPFGGIKKSGYGKENGPDGLKAFTNKKVIVY